MKFDKKITAEWARENGLVLAAGKTKLVVGAPGENTVCLLSTDDITAGDGAKHDIIGGKGGLSTRTTCNVFRLLQTHGVPVAFHEQLNEVAFLAPACLMLPYEVVVRRQAFGSYLDRNPHVSKGTVFEDLVLEFFLKTSGKKWKGRSSDTIYDLPKDDPLAVFDYDRGEVDLYYPGHNADERKTAPKDALVGQQPFLTLPLEEVFSVQDEWILLDRMGNIAMHTFLILEDAWKKQGGVLIDFKVEFGLDSEGRLMLADVIDNDAWRVLLEGVDASKQAYREGADLDEVMKKFLLVAEITDHFVPESQ